MAKKRSFLTVSGWIFGLLIVVGLLVIAVLYFRGAARVQAPTPPEIPQQPQEKPKSEAPKPKIADKPKEKIKPPKIVDDVPGKVSLCPGNSERATIASDGRLLGHHPYPDASASNLSSAPEGFNSGSCSQLHSDAKLALQQMLTAARASDPALADAMIGLSCFRSAKYQREVFCRKVADGFAVRARASAPPGYSEHATGYALDFGDRTVPDCHLSACFATTPVGQWLASNAGKYGFVLSFPHGNAQGVMYEPWHYRYEGSATARATFAGAN